MDFYPPNNVLIGTRISAELLQHLPPGQKVGTRT
jgi:hypothetical protein